MGLSKSNRILILLGIDTAFFLLELAVGYAVHSLALVADSFHMLNDVLSLCVGLWAVKVANQKTNSKMYTYGWQRAETLGALINGVFLVALCLSIFLEAIQRFAEPREVSHPKLVLVVGCFGLASNIIGLFLFHEHGHTHADGHGHLHSMEGSTGRLRDAEEGLRNCSGRSGNRARAAFDRDASPGHMQDDRSTATARKSSQNRTIGLPWQPGSPTTDIPSRKTGTPTQHVRSQRHSRSRSRGYSSLDEIYVHPASFRNEIIAASRLEDVESGSVTEDEADQESSSPSAGNLATETSPLLHVSGGKFSPSQTSLNHVYPGPHSTNWHKSHKHKQPKAQGKKGGHSHGDLNMRGVFLHVMGDALGNIGVVASALFIWLTDFWWRFYSDPLISLVITVIILCSAIPLCKAASRILLQAVPAGISVDDIKDDILELPGIISCHHVHVWQLNDTKLIASLHVQVGFDFKGEGSARYMELAREIRSCLHDYGIHSSTIQPEFCLDAKHDDACVPRGDDSCEEEFETSNSGSTKPKPFTPEDSNAGSLREGSETCLLECGDECGNGNQCCTPSGLRDGDLET